MMRKIDFTTVKSPTGDTPAKGSAIVNWDYEPKVHEGYTDLGKYIIDLGIIDQAGLDRGIAMINSRVDSPSVPSCTGVVKRNSRGEVILGRNMDLEVSNFPVYISHFVGGKYQTVAFYYNNKGEYTYKDYQNGLKLPEGYREMFACAAYDALNEAGLYMECDMRTGTGHTSTGTNPGGKRVCMGTLAAIVTQNAATVAEALEFIRTKLDVFSQCGTESGESQAGWDGGYMIGDATGEFGVIEFCRNEVYYTPYANGHANTYIHPNLYGYNRNAAGFGRLARAQQAMVGAETAKDMMEAAHTADWYHIIEDIKYSYKDEKGNVHFVDRNGDPSIDYRSENPEFCAVDDDGNYIYEEYSWEEAIAQCEELREFNGNMSGSFGGYQKAARKDDNKIGQFMMKIGVKVVAHYHRNCTNEWLLDNKNFEQVKQAYIDLFERQNAFELLEKFFAGDDKEMRDRGDILTTGMNFGVNCNKKHIMGRFQEDPECVYEYQW